MKWQSEGADLAKFQDGFPDLSGAAVAMCAVADHRGELFDAERAEIGTMAEVRQMGFSSGRYCAHAAQKLLGLAPQAVERDDRVPIWPGHSRGSITHSRTTAAAIAAVGYDGVGIDLEETGRVTEKLYESLFSGAEISQLEGRNFDAASVMFSAKEAGYKAVYPLAQKYVGFHEAEVRLSTDHREFIIDYLGQHEACRVLNEGKGYWYETAGQVLTIFVIP